MYLWYVLFFKIPNYSNKSILILVLAGISHMRIPLAYWYFQVEAGEPFPQPVLDDNNPERLVWFKICLPGLEKIQLSYISILILSWYKFSYEQYKIFSALFYLKRGLKWMEELGVQVILQLHTGPGSQNGYDNSGHQYVKNYSLSFFF